jgi:hypothetical protein
MSDTGVCPGQPKPSIKLFMNSWEVAPFNVDDMPVTKWVLFRFEQLPYEADRWRPWAVRKKASGWLDD